MLDHPTCLAAIPTGGRMQRRGSYRPVRIDGGAASLGRGAPGHSAAVARVGAGPVGLEERRDLGRIGRTPGMRLAHAQRMIEAGQAAQKCPRHASALRPGLAPWKPRSR